MALFAGAGGGLLGSRLLGWTTVCAVEIEQSAREMLARRQNDGVLDLFPVWDDIRTFGGKPWRGIVDVVSGGFPCQDISAAGQGKGIEGERSGLWKEMARVISEVRPKFVWVENSPMLVSRGLAVVLADLAEMGFDARWGVVGGNQFEESPILRERIFVLASTAGVRLDMFEIQRRISKKSSRRWEADSPFISLDYKEKKYPEVPEFNGMDNGVANRVDRIKAIGNGQVPAVVKLAWDLLNEQN